MTTDNKDLATAVVSVSSRPRLNASLSRYVGALKSPRAIIAVSLIVILCGLALLAPVIFPGGYDEQGRNSLAGPSWAHPFGTDEIGRDVFTRAIYGLRTDLSLVFVAVPLSMIIGTLLGLLGAISVRLGNVVQRVLDIIVGFPGLILGICVVLVIGPGWIALALTIVIVGLPSFGRLARSALMTQQSREYVIAARTLGVSNGRIMMRHILPNAVDPVIVQGAVYVVGAVFIEAGLSIVGLGIQPPEPSLGALLNVGMRYVQAQPTYVLGPTIILILVALAFSLLADALNDSVNRK